jgi:hypothetical protein
MNKHILGLVAVGAVLSGAAFAADTSSTVVREIVKPLGVSPQIGYVEATATNATNGFTFDLPVAKKTSDIIGVVLVGYASGTHAVKPLSISVNGRTVTVSGSTLPSGTLAVGDYVKGTVIFRP